MQLPIGDSDYSLRVKRVKEEFTVNWRRNGLPEAEVTKAQQRKGERGVWQPKFWEHTIVDETDLERCVDYIHWNPRKHGLVSRIKDWKWSSFHRFAADGQYDQDWGGQEPVRIQGDGPWGE
jgi:putative transposase